ncbi:hypothetical protein G7Y29_07340 [Corynebacterium qintianiae]|uniref:SAV-6107-like HEPN domain-containing protein n=1 Tax=Corynebacterium qintianiae TaxID=2709392 RepID=A0A7T0KM02_9CORY|nr:SAV_6107 family HEPN domain-containing protein [Corynebacterium qintianiae]QPK82690.1 hypothetical protein G7Y29_07340 [Corynebacterium qintianiae]
MNSIVSATTNSVLGSGAGMSQRDAFLSSAYALLAQAKEDFDLGAFDVALENSYRAALRVAGSVNADSPVIQKRKRLPTSAWEKLALTSDRGKEWAAAFSAYSRERGRVVSGIEANPDPHAVRTLIELTSQFLEDSTPGVTGVTLVA